MRRPFQSPAVRHLRAVTVYARALNACRLFNAPCRSLHCLSFACLSLNCSWAVMISGSGACQSRYAFGLSITAMLCL